MSRRLLLGLAGRCARGLRHLRGLPRRREGRAPPGLRPRRARVLGAVQEHPDNLTYKRSLERARLRASEAHTNAGRRLAGRGLYKEALDEFRLALDLNPDAGSLAAEIQAAERPARPAPLPPTWR